MLKGKVAHEHDFQRGTIELKFGFGKAVGAGSDPSRDMQFDLVERKIRRCCFFLWLYGIRREQMNGYW